MGMRAVKVNKKTKLVNHTDMKKMKVFKKTRVSEEVATEHSASLCRTLSTWCLKTERIKFQVGPTDVLKC